MSTDTANRQLAAAGKGFRLCLSGSILALAALVMAGFSAPAQANMVSNGSFSSFSGSSGSCPGAQTQQVTNSNLSGWTPETTNNYDFVLNSNNYGSFANSTNGGFNSCIGLQQSIGASPDGGNFFASDASYLNPGPYTIATTITGLVSGATYNLSFYMGAGQQTGFTGSTDDWWTVGLTNTAGVGASQTTGDIDMTDPNNCGFHGSHGGCGVGFSGWVAETMQFVAGGMSQVLWFMGGSTAASGQPPFVLLDGVNLTMVNNVTPVPEPPAYAMLMAGLLALLGVRHVYRRKA
jgi:hypothetical protein